MLKLKKCKFCRDEFTQFSSFQNHCQKEECKEKALEIKVKKAMSNLKKHKTKEKKEKRNALKELSNNKSGRSLLQDEVNKLARMIDKKFEINTCIDCGLQFNEMIDGGHCQPVSGNENIRYNLHNIHSQRRSCNSFKGGRKHEYLKGIEFRYGMEYKNYLEFEQKTTYKLIKLSNVEVDEKLKIARKLVRTFDTFSFIDPIQARNILNSIIGIYKEPFEKKYFFHFF